MVGFDKAMSRFVNRQNLNRYRRLASERTDDATRIMILKLLAEEQAKFIQGINRTSPRSETGLIVRQSGRDENQISIEQ